MYGLQTIMPFSDTSAMRVTLTIYLFYSLHRFVLVLGTSMTCIKYKYIYNDLSFYLQGDLYYIFILQSLHPCTGFTITL